MDSQNRDNVSVCWSIGGGGGDGTKTFVGAKRSGLLLQHHSKAGSAPTQPISDVTLPPT